MLLWPFFEINGHESSVNLTKREGEGLGVSEIGVCGICLTLFREFVGFRLRMVWGLEVSGIGV